MLKSYCLCESKRYALKIYSEIHQVYAKTLCCPICWLDALQCIEFKLLERLVRPQYLEGLETSKNSQNCPVKKLSWHLSFDGVYIFGPTYTKSKESNCIEERIAMIKIYKKELLLRTIMYYCLHNSNRPVSELIGQY